MRNLSVWVVAVPLPIEDAGAETPSMPSDRMGLPGIVVFRTFSKILTVFGKGSAFSIEISIAPYRFGSTMNPKFCRASIDIPSPSVERKNRADGLPCMTTEFDGG